MTNESKKSIYIKSLLNRKAVKEYILKRSEVLRPGWPFTGVSKEALDEVEAFIKNSIDKGIKKHPSRGKRFRWLQLYS